MNDDVTRFNRLSRGRCSNKMLAMKHVCELSDIQYRILCMKWCTGRRGYTREEISEKLYISPRTVDREYADARQKILKIIDMYGQDGYKGDFFFDLDEKLTGYDWSLRGKDNMN